MNKDVTDCQPSPVALLDGGLLLDVFVLAETKVLEFEPSDVVWQVAWQREIEERICKRAKSLGLEGTNWRRPYEREAKRMSMGIRMGFELAPDQGHNVLVSWLGLEKRWDSDSLYRYEAYETHVRIHRLLYDDYCGEYCEDGVLELNPSDDGWSIHQGTTGDSVLDFLILVAWEDFALIHDALLPQFCWPMSVFEV